MDSMSKRMVKLCQAGKGGHLINIAIKPVGNVWLAEFFACSTLNVNQAAAPVNYIVYRHLLTHTPPPVIFHTVLDQMYNTYILYLIC